MKIDPTMLKQINSAVDASLKKNKDIKAAADVEKVVADYVKKNKIGLENTQRIMKLEALVKTFQKQIADMKKAEYSNWQSIFRNMTRHDELAKQGDQRFKLIESELRSTDRLAGDCYELINKMMADIEKLKKKK